MTLHRVTVTVSDEGDLTEFDPNHENLEQGSIINDHCVTKYLMHVHVSMLTWAYGKDMHSKIASFDRRRTTEFELVGRSIFQWWKVNLQGRSMTVSAARRQAHQELTAVELVANKRLLKDMAAEDGCTDPLGLITFNGNSTNGKSFLISELIGSGCWTPYVISPKKICRGSTTGDCSMFALDKTGRREIWCLDCEGTNGTCFPSALGQFGKDMLSHLGMDHYRARADLVRRTLPIFSFVMGHVFVYVTRESCANLTAYGEVLEYALSATQCVQKSIKPSLIVIENKAPCSKHSIDETTAAFMRNDAESGDSFLRANFQNVKFVQIFVKGTPRYQARLAEIRKLLIKTAETNLKCQKAELGFDVDKAGWCNAAERVVEAIGDGKGFEPDAPEASRRRQVNMHEVLAGLMEKKVKFFFSDSLDVFRVLDDGQYESLHELKRGKKEAWEIALDHAARLIACEFKDVDVDLAKRELQTTLTRLLKSLRGGLCCCAKRSNGKTSFCGQPFMSHHHHEHKSLHKKEKHKRSLFFWTKTYLESNVWAGEFQSDSDIVEWAGNPTGDSPEVDQRIINEIWTRAEEYMVHMSMRFSATAMADVAWERLPACHKKMVGRGDREGTCFLCMLPIWATSLAPGALQSKIQVCTDCAKRFVVLPRNM